VTIVANGSRRVQWAVFRSLPENRKSTQHSGLKAVRLYFAFLTRHWLGPLLHFKALLSREMLRPSVINVSTWKTVTRFTSANLRPQHLVDGRGRKNPTFLAVIDSVPRPSSWFHNSSSRDKDSCEGPMTAMHAQRAPLKSVARRAGSRIVLPNFIKLRNRVIFKLPRRN